VIFYAPLSSHTPVLSPLSVVRSFFRGISRQADQSVVVHSLYVVSVCPGLLCRVWACVLGFEIIIITKKILSNRFKSSW